MLYCLKNISHFCERNRNVTQRNETFRYKKKAKVSKKTDKDKWLWIQRSINGF